VPDHEEWRTSCVFLLSPQPWLPTSFCAAVLLLVRVDGDGLAAAVNNLILIETYIIMTRNSSGTRCVVLFFLRTQFFSNETRLLAAGKRSGITIAAGGRSPPLA